MGRKGHWCTKKMSFTRMDSFLNLDPSEYQFTIFNNPSYTYLSMKLIDGFTSIFYQNICTSYSQKKGFTFYFFLHWNMCLLPTPRHIIAQLDFKGPWPAKNTKKNLIIIINKVNEAFFHYFRQALIVFTTKLEKVVVYALNEDFWIWIF